MFARIEGLIAEEANQAVIFRRGPSKWTQQLLWDLNTDEVKPGQWIKGRVYVEASDVSPNGRYLVAALFNESKTTVRRRGHTEEDRWRAAHGVP